MKKVIILITIIILIKSVVQTIAAKAIINNQSTIINKTDSLFILLKTAKADTTLVNTYNELFREYYSSNPDTAIYFANSALNLSIKANYKKGISASYYSIGSIHYYKGNYDKAIEFYFKSLKICEELGDKKGMAYCYGNIGIVHDAQGRYDKAIEYYFKNLKIAEELQDKNGMAKCYTNIGYTFTQQREYNKAVKFFLKSLKITQEIDNKFGTSKSNRNIGYALYSQGVFVNDNSYKKDSLFYLSIEFYLKSLKISKELGDKREISGDYANIAVVYTDLGLFDKAIEYYTKSSLVFEELGDKNSISLILISLSGLHLKAADSLKEEFSFKSHLQKAREIGEKGFKIAKEINAMPLENEAASILMKVYKKLGNYKKSIEYADIFISTKDSMFSEEKTKAFAEMGAKYEAEKRELTIQKLEKEKLLQTETLARKEAESKKQRILLFSFLAGFIIILVFSVFLYRLFVQKKMANAILQQQKEEISAQRDEIETQRDLVTQQKEHIEEIHKEVTDSINYAKRIQEAILPVSVAARSVMGEHFVLFRPKDIVSGDFYWTTKINNWLIVAVADCTGHGVPGAFMSMLGISFLNEIVNKKEVTKANQVLNQLRAEIINALQQKGAQGEQKDGMDISLCVINTITMECQWSGANNPLLIVRNNQLSIDNNQLSIDNLIEIKPDKQPIAIHPEMKDFTNHEIQLSKGDIIYLASDGYEDQFGGPKGKKFLSKRLKELIIDNCLLTMEEQKQILETTLVDWIGEGEQIDDITILGIRI